MEKELNEKQISILEIAEELFAIQGYHGTSIREIADKASINIAMISYYFGSKEKLLETLFQYRIGSSTIQLEHLNSNKSLEPFSKINIIVDYYVDMVYKRPNFARLLHTFKYDKENTLLLSIIMESKQKNYNLIVELLKEGQKKGVFKKSIDPIFLINLLVATTHHSVHNIAFYKKIHQLEDQPDEVVQSIIIKKTKQFLKQTFKSILQNAQ